MGLSESQNLDAAARRVMNELSAIEEKKATWEDSRHNVVAGLELVVTQGDETGKTVKGISTKVDLIHGLVIEAAENGKNGNVKNFDPEHVPEKEKDEISAGWGRFRITARGRKTVAVVLRFIDAVLTRIGRILAFIGLVYVFAFFADRLPDKWKPIPVLRLITQVDTVYNAMPINDRP